jgi:hypothetical protein
MEALIVFKIVGLFLAVWMTIVNVARISKDHSVPAINFIYQTVGIVLFVVIQFELYK